MNRALFWRPSPSMAVAVIALVVAASGAAVASIPNPDSSVDVCYQNHFKKLRFVRVIDTGAGENCTSHETALAVATMSGGKVADSNKLDGLDSTDFLGATTAAGGDLTGNYPNPDIASGAIGTGELSSSIPAAHVVHSADQSVPDGGTLRLAFDTERHDTATMHDTSTDNSRLVAPTDGIYLITAGTYWGPPGGGVRGIDVRKNAAPNGAGPVLAWDQRNAVGSGEAQGTLATVARLAANDYVELFVFQNSGSSVGLLAGATQFSMTWLAPGP